MLFEKLNNNNKIPFHMPGHKRNTKLLGVNLPYEIDITEIDGFDNLHNPSGVIKDIEYKFKSIYNCRESFILINGSTCGIISAIFTVVEEGDKVLVARNCHKSVYNGIQLAKAEAVYLQPEYDEYGIAGKISADDVRVAVERDDIKLVIITSPTYEGVVSDVDDICDIAHSKGIPVLLDSAHGAHYFEESRADIVVMSLHKTLPALTQCAIANINGNIVDGQKFRISLSIFETSSPSYILMSSIDRCADFILQNSAMFEQHNLDLDKFFNQLNKLQHLKIIKYDDLNKIIIFTGYSSISACKLSEMLRNTYNIEVEMVSREYILAMSSVCDTYENLDTLAKALIEIDSELEYSSFTPLFLRKLPMLCYPSHKVKKGRLIDIRNAVNEISAEYIWSYPPGIPLLVPGEVINDEIIDYIINYNNNQIDVHSTYGMLPEKIYCAK